MYALKLFSKDFYDTMFKFNLSRFINDKTNADLIANKGMEFHALSSAIKPFSTWLSRDAIQDCRESCGGHGYLKSKCEHFTRGTSFSSNCICIHMAICAYCSYISVMCVKISYY